MTQLGWKHLTRRDRRVLARGVRDGIAYGGPFHVEIYPADRCNIDCFFCSTAAVRGTDELPLPLFEQLLAELKELGTRSIRIAGGGEPLFHRNVKGLLRAIVASGIPLENLTTNAVILDDETAELLAQCCDEVTVSLNTADEGTYASMMRTPARNFARVLANVRRLTRVRRARRPQLTLQFLVWRDNYRTIPAMYELARELRVDTILFNGLSFLRPEQKMSQREIDEMLALYEEVIRRDEFRRIANIESYECDIREPIRAIITRLADERRRVPFHRRALHFFTRNDYPLAEKVRHHVRIRRATRSYPAADEACIIGWYSLVIRSDGSVNPCCILQGKRLADVRTQSVHEIWYGPAFTRLREELGRIIRGGEAWRVTDERIAGAGCGIVGADLCPQKSFYYSHDARFMKDLRESFASRRAEPG